MQASRTAHYAWLYRGSRGSQRGQAQGWSNEVAIKSTASAPESRLGVNTLRQRVSPLARSLIVEAGVTAAAARTHFIEAQIAGAVESGIRQMVWLGPRAAQPSARGGEQLEQGVEVEVFRLEADTLDTGRGARGARAMRATQTIRTTGTTRTTRTTRTTLNRSLVRSAPTLFVCDGLLDRTPSAQIQAIFRTIGDSCFGSRLAFVYLDSGSVSAHVSSSGSQKPRCAVPRLGEPIRVGIEQRSLPALLAGAGLVLDADIGLSEYVRRALGEAASDLRGDSGWRLALAHVRARAVLETTVLETSVANDPLN